jgi:hypothetical protein
MNILSNQQQQQQQQQQKKAAVIAPYASVRKQDLVWALYLSFSVSSCFISIDFTSIVDVSLDW